MSRCDTQIIKRVRVRDIEKIDVVYLELWFDDLIIQLMIDQESPTLHPTNLKECLEFEP